MTLLQSKGCYNTDELLKIHQNCVDSCCKAVDVETVNGGESVVKTLEAPPKYLKGFKGRKLNPLYIKWCFEREGYNVLKISMEPKTRIYYICDNNHNHNIRWDHFYEGQRCNFCVGNHGKITHDFVYKYFQKKGYVLLTRYKNAYTPLYFICPNKHKHCITWDSFTRGHRCGKCFEATLKGSKNLTAYTIFGRTIKYGQSNIPEDELRQLIEIEILPKIQSFYNDTPSGCNVDHVVPFTFFDHNDAEQIKACWSVYNLRYLTASENFSRGNRFNIDDIEKLPFKVLNHAIAIALNAKKTPKKYKEAIKHLMIFDSVESDYDEHWQEIINN